MPNEALGSYLNDHLAGSVSAIHLLERAAQEHAGTALGPRLAGLLDAIRVDQDELRSLIGRMGYSENRLKQAGAWVAEQAGRFKVGGSAEDGLARLELFEALSMGIHGKVKLWRALRAVAARHAALRSVDLTRLERRAQEQHDLVEAWRLEAAESAL